MPPRRRARNIPRNVPVAIQDQGNLLATNLRINRQRVFSQGFKFNRLMDRNEALQYIRNPLNFQFQAGTNYEFCSYNSYGQRSGKVFNSNTVNDNGILYDINEEYDEDHGDDTFQYLYLFQWRDRPRQRAGGDTADEYNNCLYWCINHALGGDEFMPKEIKNPKKFKEFLEIDQRAKVDISLIPKLESLLIQKSKTKDVNGKYIDEQYCSITISGDYQYHSPFTNTCLNINIRLKNGHYELINNDGRNNQELILKYQREFFPEPLSKSNVWSLYQNYIFSKDENNEEKFNTVTNLQLYNMRKNNIFVKADIRKKDLKDSDSSETIIYTLLKECYENYIKNCDELIELKGPNPYKYASINAMTIDYFRMKSEIFKSPEACDELESVFISNSNGGGLNYCKVGTFEHVYEYDKINCYASQMCSESLVPTKKPKFYFITEPNNNKYFKFGIYRARVIIPEGFEYKHVFQLKRTGYYTHVCLNLAIELGFQVILTVDDKYNACVYDGLVKMHYVFKKYQKYLFDLKSNKIAKSMMSMIYGALIQKNRKYKYANVVNDSDISNTKNIDIDDITDIKFSVSGSNISNFDVQNVNVNYVNKTSYYKYPELARIGPFLTSLVRKLMSSYVQKIPVDNIVRIHTDSICCIGRVECLDKLLGNSLGMFKLKKEDSTIVIHSQNNFEYS